MTTAQAYESILTFAPVSNRSEETARRAVECAQELVGGIETKSFGWSRRQKRERLYDEQIAILRRFAEDLRLPGLQIASQGEHDVWHENGASHVLKVTNQGRFGFAVDQENDNRSNKLCLRHALPSEYLLRLGTQNVVFGDAISLQGICAGAIPGFLTAQPEVDLGRPSQPDIHAFFEQCGFIRLPDEMMMSQFSHKPFWYRDEDGIVVADANPENFSRIEDTIIVPIDVITHPLDPGLIRHTAHKNGVNFDRLLASAGAQGEA